MGLLPAGSRRYDFFAAPTSDGRDGHATKLTCAGVSPVNDLAVWGAHWLYHDYGEYQTPWAG